jgi:hypothetical protein
MSAGYEYPHIRPEMRKALEAYRLEHQPVGGFLQAVIANDLMGAIGRADTVNGTHAALRDFAWYVHNELPGPARDHDAWTTCRCGPGSVGGRPVATRECFVHTWTPEMAEAAR